MHAKGQREILKIPPFGRDKDFSVTALLRNDKKENSVIPDFVSLPRT